MRYLFISILSHTHTLHGIGPINPWLAVRIGCTESVKLQLTSLNKGRARHCCQSQLPFGISGIIWGEQNTYENTYDDHSFIPRNKKKRPNWIFSFVLFKKKKVHPVPGSNPSKKKNCVLPFGCKQNCTEIMHIYTRMGNNRKIDKRVEFENNKKNVRLAECLMASDVAVPPSYRAWIQHIKCIYVVESPMIQDSTPVQ